MASERRPLDELAPPRGSVDELLVERGPEDPRRDRVHVDAAGRPLDGQRPRERGHGRLARVVGRHLHERHERPEGGDVHDPAAPAPEHVPPEDLAGAEGPGQVRVEDPVPLLLGDVERRRPLRAGGAVHEDVDPPERGDARREGRLERGAVGDVGYDAERPAAEALDLRRGRVHRLEVPRRRDDVRPRLREAAREGEADPRGPADDDRDAPLEGEAREGHLALRPRARPAAAPAEAAWCAGSSSAACA